MTCAPVVVRTTEKLSKNQYLSERILYQISPGWALKLSFQMVIGRCQKKERADRLDSLIQMTIKGKILKTHKSISQLASQAQRCVNCDSLRTTFIFISVHLDIKLLGMIILLYFSFAKETGTQQYYVIVDHIYI